MVDLKQVQKKWQNKWKEAKVFEANPDNRKKYFLTFPYPYINGLSHIGHLYTIMRVEALARFKRLNGYNVLFPQGWHATGSPIVNAAKRVKSKEEKQMKIMRGMGFSDEEITPFEEPEYWIKYFAPQFESDYRSMGLSIDWRRNFYTTSLNPYYDKFIQWQFRTLKDKGYIIKGKFPVVWDPVDKCAVGDHARMEGEGETPQEFCLFKFKLDDGRSIITATLRPDTVMGITNLYVNPEETYVAIDVTKESGIEHWIVGKPILEKLSMQDYIFEEKSNVPGTELVGQMVESFSGLKIPVLPASFLDSKYGTGMVHSVPSDSADDLIALRNFQEDNEKIAKFGLDTEMVKAIEPIPIFDTPEIGACPADHFLKEYKVTSQNDRQKLDMIKKELYTLTFNKATYNEKYKTGFSEDLFGKIVKDGQELIKRDLLAKGAIDIFYELTGKVVSRSLTECVVKIVDDQWFMDYNSPEWKKLAHKCLDKMTLFPAKAKAQFNYVIDWLHEWACTREEGLGTKLPWDNKWLIESLSDSTIYMAYYTIAHILQNIPIEQVDDNLFNYIFLDKGDKPNTDSIDEMKSNFDYYYPVDFRNSGKDLIQNHLTFFIFNHVAIFPEDKWPQGIGVNGWVTVDGQKMSKSLGNMIPLRDMADEFSIDASRLTILNGGEEMDDPNWDSSFAKSMIPKLNGLYDFSIEHYGKHERSESIPIDAWFESEMNIIIKEATLSMEATLFRTAIQKAYFDMQRILRYYTRRTNGDFHKILIDQFIESQLIMLSPFTPHICEECWEGIGKEGFISSSTWPTYDASKIDEKLSIKEDYLENVRSDILTVKRLAKVETISKITIFVSLDWKYKFFDIVKSSFDEGIRDFKVILGKIMAKEDLKMYSKDITKLLPQLLKKGLHAKISSSEELLVLENEIDALSNEFDSATIKIIHAENSTDSKAKSASPSKPAILLE